MSREITNWTLMRYFLEVARAGSLSGAKDRLGASQPTIGRKIDDFEHLVGEKVFIRTAHGVDLTEVGRRVLVVAERMETLARTVNVEATGEVTLSGVIRCKVTDGIGGYWLPLMLEQFHAEHPHITVDVTVCDGKEVPDLSRREADLTVVYRPPTDPDVCILASDNAIGMPMAARSYIEAYGQPSTFEELLDHRFCAHNMHFVAIEPWARLAAVLQHHRKIVYRSNSSLAVCQAVRRGLGISYMPIGVMDREEDLVFFDIEGYAPQQPFWLVCHRDVKDIPSIRAMVNYIKASLFRGLKGSLSRRLGEE